MTAPIVRHILRVPMSKTAVKLTSEITSSTKIRMQRRTTTDTPGQLWQRLAARDVQTYGQPKPLRIPYGRPPAEAALQPDRAKDARAFLDEEIALRRRRHVPIIVEGEIEVCCQCVNELGYYVEWGQANEANHRVGRAS